MKTKEEAKKIIAERIEQGADQVGGPTYPLTTADIDYLREGGFSQGEIDEIDALVSRPIDA